MFSVRKLWPSRQRVGREIHRPPLERSTGGRKGHGLDARQSLAPSSTDLQAGGFVDPVHRLVIHRQAFALQRRVHTPIAEPSADCGVRLKRVSGCSLVAFVRRWYRHVAVVRPITRHARRTLVPRV
jgi:hypothetical protein